MDTIRELDYNYIRGLNIKSKDLIFPSNSLYFGLFEGDAIVSLLALKISKNRAKLQANYTFPEHRRKGYFTKLLEYVIINYKQFDIYADCLNSSVNIYKKLGFEQYSFKSFKNFDIYYVRLLREVK